MQVSLQIRITREQLSKCTLHTSSNDLCNYDHFFLSLLFNTLEFVVSTSFSSFVSNFDQVEMPGKLIHSPPHLFVCDYECINIVAKKPIKRNLSKLESTHQ